MDWLLLGRVAHDLPLGVAGVAPTSRILGGLGAVAVGGDGVLRLAVSVSVGTRSRETGHRLT